MKILISNDDGISADGIKALYKALKTVAEVTVVAPLTEQSAVGHAITMKIPLRVTEVEENGEFFGYAVDGTPADCIKMGIRNILGQKPDMVISGINKGSNTAINILYSGTVSAAREAAIMDVPSVAISLADNHAVNFETAAAYALRAVEYVNKYGLPRGTLLNINVPDLPLENVAGVKFTSQGKSKWDDVYEKRVDPYGSPYYWLTGELIEMDLDQSTDQGAVNSGYVSVSPIHFDLTDYDCLGKMEDRTF